jgi:hypothetical protein
MAKHTSTTRTDNPLSYRLLILQRLYMDLRQIPYINDIKHGNRRHSLLVAGKEAIAPI